MIFRCPECKKERRSGGVVPILCTCGFRDRTGQHLIASHDGEVARPKKTHLRRAHVLQFVHEFRSNWDLAEPVADAGYTYEYAETNRFEANQFDRTIQIVRPLVVLNRAFAVPCEQVRHLADKYKTVQFVTVNHSSQSHLCYAPTWLGSQNAFLRLVQEMPNCWLASPDERNIIRRLLDIDRCIYLPNTVALPTHPGDTKTPVVFRLLMAGRRDMIKNFPNQIVAAAIASKAIPLELHICVRGESKDLLDMARLAGVHAELVKWSDRSSHEERLSSYHIGLQSSFSESFNYVAIELMARGVPVVGSPAIRYLPQHWQANPDDPMEIADTIVKLAKDWENERLLARRVAEDVAETNAIAFKMQLTEILERSQPIPIEYNPRLPGDSLHLYIAEKGFEEDEGCACHSMRLKMNAHPIEWSYENIERIASGMVAEARRRQSGISAVVPELLLRATARRWVRAALRRCRQARDAVSA